MRQSLSQVFPTPGSPALAIGPTGIRVLAPPELGAIPMGGQSPAAYGPSMGISVWPAPRAPRAPFRLRVSDWRARNWRRALLTWFVLSLALMVVAAHFPGSLREATGVVIAAVPVLFAALP
jgi:hypothetical protein